MISHHSMTTLTLTEEACVLQKRLIFSCRLKLASVMITHCRKKQSFVLARVSRLAVPGTQTIHSTPSFSNVVNKGTWNSLRKARSVVSSTGLVMVFTGTYGFSSDNRSQQAVALKHGTRKGIDDLVRRPNEWIPPIVSNVTWKEL